MATTWSDVILQHIDKEQRELYTAMPATITDVSKLTSENSVSVQPVLDFIDSDGTAYPMPILEDIPVQWQSGGGAIVTFPLAVGDDVLVVFSMRSIVEFQLSTEGTTQQFDNRHHSLSDGFVIGGIYRDQNNPSPNADDFEIRYNDSEITIQKDGTILLDRNGVGTYKINPDGTHTNTCSETWSMTNGTGELIDLLSQTLTEISNSTVNTMLGAQPLINKVAIQALIAMVDSFKE